MRRFICISLLAVILLMLPSCVYENTHHYQAGDLDTGDYDIAPAQTGCNEEPNETEECPTRFWEEQGLDPDMMRNQSHAITTADYIHRMFPGSGMGRPQAYPDFFGGIYLNSAGNLVVLIVESHATSDEAADFLARVENAGGAIVREVEFSQSKLLSLQYTLMYYFDQSHPASRVIRGSGLNTKANRVTVYLLSHCADDMNLFRDEIANSPAIVFYNQADDTNREPSQPLRVHPLLEDISMAVTSIDRDNGSVVVTIFNDSPYAVATGYPFLLEVYSNGWWVVPGHYAFRMIGYGIHPGGSKDFTKNLVFFVGTMEPGLYRIRKDVSRWADTPITDSDKHDIVAEFVWE